jgi:hypothetical protein
MFKPDMATSHVVDLPRVRTFASGDGRLHAAWPTLVNGHPGAVAATLAASADAVELSEPITLWPATTDVALADAAGGPDGSYAAVWWGPDGPGLTEVDATGAVQVTTDLATERPLPSRRSRSTRSPAVCWRSGAKEPPRPVTGRSPGRSEVIRAAVATVVFAGAIRSLCRWSAAHPARTRYEQAHRHGGFRRFRPRARRAARAAR